VTSCVEDESKIPVHMDVAKAMFDEHVQLMQLPAEPCESIWMLEEEVRHYWVHLAAVAIRVLNEMTT
jgi:hypothetical protein